MNTKREFRPVLLATGALALTIWGAIGLYQGAQQGFSGGLYTPEYVVPGVLPGSSAAKAGLQPGDRVISVEGTPVERLGMESRWPRAMVPRAGESRRFFVARSGGEYLLLNIVYEPPSRDLMSHRIGAGLMGVAWLLPGLWVFLALRSGAALRLAGIGMAAAASGSFGLGPSLGRWNGVPQHLSTALVVLLFILLLMFFLRYPKPKRAGESRLARWAIWLPWFGLLGFLITEMIVHPALYYTTGSVASWLILAYGILTVAAITHTVVKNSRADLLASGVYLIIAGLVVAILAIAGGIVWNAPGWSYAIAILPAPLCMAVAVWKATKSLECAPATRAAHAV